jgi:ubiquinone/menaquinone biosynthesis C-methylase UbiE
MTVTPKDLDTIIVEYQKVTERLPNEKLAAELKVISALKVSNELLFLMNNLDVEPYARMGKCLVEETAQLAAVTISSDGGDGADNQVFTEGVGATKKLYENIWTIYNNETYDHSMQLCLKRYEANGFAKRYFEGKTVFDGGCGTGRFSIAAALMGAEKVYGMDLGGQSLDFARQKAKEYKVDSVVDFIEGDVTSLTDFTDESIDFVVSNGVLHHTSDPMKGLREHYRILKTEGKMWLYLYGKNGLLWQLYDVLKGVLKGVGAEFTRSYLLKLDIRQGLIYSFMDNAFAPIRNYYNTTEIISVLDEVGTFQCDDMRGINFLDDYTLQMGASYGKSLLGEECEVRQIIEKK